MQQTIRHQPPVRHSVAVHLRSVRGLSQRPQRHSVREFFRCAAPATDGTVEVRYIAIPRLARHVRLLAWLESTEWSAHRTWARGSDASRQSQMAMDIGR
jgi:hypothetical protein